MKSGFYLVFCLFAFITLSPAQSSSSQDDQPNIVPRNSPRDAPSKKRTTRPTAPTENKPADNQDQPNQSQRQTQNQTQGESSSQPVNSGNGESSSRDSQVDFNNQPQPTATRSEPDAQNFDFDPHKAAKDVEIGRFYFSRKNYRAALDRFREALLYKPNDAEATYGMAQTLERLDLPDQAYQEYGKYLEVLPEGPFAKDSKIAIERIKPLLHASKSEPEKRAADDLATGELLLARNDFDGAREHFEDALRQSPENALAYLRLAESLRGLQRLDEARFGYKKYIELQPNGKYAAEAKKAISDIDWILGK
ncbi:MAG TPA: tetratricopeptide repeat protein [Candidatus Angelobacter sp.]|nr:tetratricopeptide repeat protein [Candidatus Angelobacter sp.]